MSRSGVDLCRVSQPVAPPLTSSLAPPTSLVDSSNGSYLYLRKPVELKLGTTTNLRLGRSLLSLRVTQKSYKRIVRSISTR